jgi:tol-pal system protein YbgF
VKKSEATKKKGSAASPNEPSHGDYDKAYAAYLAHRYDEALPLFKAFVEKYPQHHLADNAQYWVGEIYYDTEDFPTAILAFQEVVTKYGNGNKAPDALLKIGFAYIALDDPGNARIFLKRVIKNYPFSEAEAMARAKLKELENL